VWPILESLQAGRRSFQQLLLAEGVDEKGTVETILGLANQRGINIRRVPRRVIDDLADNGYPVREALILSQDLPPHN
jgi:tRNA G18 (ribose-2'-O)-methylase SpoU